MNELKTVEFVRPDDAEAMQKGIDEFLKEITDSTGVVDLSQLKKIGQGGTHDVYISPNNDNFVIKIDRWILNKAINQGQLIISPEMRNEVEAYVDNENHKNELLYKYFNKANCLKEREMIRKIKTEVGMESIEVETLISIQEGSKVFADKDKKDYSTSYAEKNITDETKEFYLKMNDALLGNSDFDETDFLQFNEKLEAIFELIDTDEDFKSKMRDFLSCFKDYFSMVGNYIDLVGRENVLFYKKDGKWAFQIGSVLKAESRVNVEEALMLLEESPEQLNIHFHSRNNLKNGLALIRLLNATGLKAGLGKIIDIQLSDKQISNLEKIKF